jgi:hypothetical protein
MFDTILTRMDKPPDKKSDWYMSPDIAAIFGMMIVPIIAVVVVTFLSSLLFQAGKGDPTMLYLALALAGIGAVLLFFARLPLYRQRRFFAIGPGTLDSKHRRLYRWAYGFIGCSVGLLLLLRFTLR